MEKFYRNYAEKIRAVKERLERPLTYAEKILYTHMESPENLKRGETNIKLKVDRIAMQDATAQMALLQFILTERDKVAVPTTIHCDHLIRAQNGADEDLDKALEENNEVYAFLKSAANKYGIGFWKPGSGIIHQVILENYASPAQLMLGTDSHTPNAGGLGMIAIGVGGADAVDVMAGEKWSIRMPKLIGIKLKGKLNGWTSPKDIILKIAEILTVKGGTGYIVEYFGDTESISATGKATITNMGAEIGATTSLFPYDYHIERYLRATKRMEIADLTNQIKDELKADPEAEENPEEYYDKVIEIDLDNLEPHIVGPHTPDLGRAVSKLSEEAEKNGWPKEFKYALIGSCTNSSYEDMQRAAYIANQAAKRGLKAKCGFMITPGSEQIYKTIKRDGQMEIFQKIGGVVLANACGPCIGQWSRKDIKKGDKNSIITSYNRNFKKRNDANPETYAFIGSPEIVTAYALAGSMDFNPLTDYLEAPNGEKFKLEAPPIVDALPSQGFVFDTSGFEAPSGEGEIVIKPNSERLAFLELFKESEKEDFQDLFVLLKAKGKCTTDHISPAGNWLKYRGHLDKISNNMFSGAVNFFTENPGTGKNILTGDVDELHKIARYYKSQGKGWIVIGDENYGEGSSREHAAMEPRYLGCKAVIVKSFARIHETNLKRQGILPLCFVNKEDYDKIRWDDKVTISDIDIQEGKNIEVIIKHSDSSEDRIKCSHTFKGEEIKWFKSGSALNYIRKKNQN